MSRPAPGIGFGSTHTALPVQKARNFGATFPRLANLFRPYRGRLLAVLGAAVGGNLFGVVSPKILGLATTSLFATSQGKHPVDYPYLEHLIFILIWLYTLNAAFYYMQQYLMVGVAQNVVYELRKRVVGRLSRLPLKFFDSHTHGEILSRVVNDLDNISSTLQQSVTQLISSVVTLVGVLAIMLWISPMLTLAVVCTVPVSLLSTVGIAKRSQGYFREQQKTLGKLNGHVEEMYTGHAVVQAFAHEQQSIQSFDALNEAHYQCAWKAQFVSSIIFPLMNFVGNLGYVFVSVVGAVMVTRRTIEIGDVQAFIQYSRQFTMPMAQLASIANSIQSTVASAERVFDLLDEPTEPEESSTGPTISQPRGAVRCERVDFSYRPGVPVIQNLSIDVQPGQTVAIVGPTGAGKTTLVNLLMRYYELDSGAILVDGVDIQQLRRDHLRRMFGMVLQDTWLFSGSIRANIAYGRDDASEDQILRAARAAQADHFIRTLPRGYDTLLNQESTNISTGQKQLLTIARALLADPAILILDEATSSVDTRTEILIQRGMRVLMEGRTCFVIAHRLSTIRDADLILVMNHGSIVEQGTHEQLLAAAGFYSELYHSQFTANLQTLRG